jgi:hypothetical protein
MEDGEKIRCEFGFWAVSRLAENQELSTILLNHEVEQLKSEPAQPVAAGNHNCELIAAHKSDQ